MRPTRDPKPFTGDMWETVICWLYRWYDPDGVLLYVGITWDPEKREQQHRRAWWRQWADRCVWDMEGRPRLEARTHEASVVAVEAPIFNRGMSPDVEARQRAYIARRGHNPDDYVSHYPRKVRRRGRVPRPLVMPADLWEQVDTMAAARRMDRDAWIEAALTEALRREQRPDA